VADFRIALGGTISAATTDEMHSALSELRHGIRKDSRVPKPLYRQLPAAITIGSMNQFDAKVLDLGSPTSGRIWRVTRVTVLGNGDTSQLTNVSAAIYIGDPTNASQLQCVQHGQQIPYTTIENDGAFIVHSKDHLFLNIVATGSATGVSVSANAVAWEYEESAISSMVI
jgi:hypothetical protein